MRGYMDRMLRRCFDFGMYAALLVMAGCVTGNSVGTVSEPGAPAGVQEIRVLPAGEERTVVEIIAGTQAPYSAFKLLDPARIVVDVLGAPDAALPTVVDARREPVSRVTVETVREELPSTRVTVHLDRDVDYGIVEKGRTIVLSLLSQKA